MFAPLNPPVNPHLRLTTRLVNPDYHSLILFLVNLREFASSTQDVWIGLHREDNSSPWMWVDGSPFVVGDDLHYQTWAPASPSEGSNELCLLMAGSYDYLWNDKGCQFENWFLCEDVGKL